MNNFLKSNLVKFLLYVLFIYLFIKLIVYDKYLDLIVNIFGDFGAVIYSIHIFILSGVITFLFIFIISWYFRRLDLFIDKKIPSRKNNIYYWIANDDVSNKLLRNLFDTPKLFYEYEVALILKEIKEILEKELEDNLTNYKLFRKYLYRKSKKSIYKKINIYLITILAPLLGAIAMPIIKNYIAKKIENQEILKIITESISFQGYAYFIIFISLAYLAYFISYQFILKFTEKNRRIDFLISILDTLIEEKENQH